MRRRTLVLWGTPVVVVLLLGALADAANWPLWPVDWLRPRRLVALEFGPADGNDAAWGDLVARARHVLVDLRDARGKPVEGVPPRLYLVDQSGAVVLALVEGSYTVSSALRGLVGDELRGYSTTEPLRFRVRSSSEIQRVPLRLAPEAAPPAAAVAALIRQALGAGNLDEVRLLARWAPSSGVVDGQRLLEVFAALDEALRAARGLPPESYRRRRVAWRGVESTVAELAAVAGLDTLPQVLTYDGRTLAPLQRLRALDEAQERALRLLEQALRTEFDAGAPLLGLQLWRRACGDTDLIAPTPRLARSCVAPPTEGTERDPGLAPRTARARRPRASSRAVEARSAFAELADLFETEPAPGEEPGAGERPSAPAALERSGAVDDLLDVVEAGRRGLVEELRRKARRARRRFERGQPLEARDALLEVAQELAPYRGLILFPRSLYDELDQLALDVDAAVRAERAWAWQQWAEARSQLSRISRPPDWVTSRLARLANLANTSTDTTPTQTRTPRP